MFDLNVDGTPSYAGTFVDIAPLSGRVNAQFPPEPEFRPDRLDPRQPPAGQAVTIDLNDTGIRDLLVDLDARFREEQDNAPNAYLDPTAALLYSVSSLFDLIQMIVGAAQDMGLKLPDELPRSPLDVCWRHLASTGRSIGKMKFVASDMRDLLMTILIRAKESNALLRQAESALEAKTNELNLARNAALEYSDQLAATKRLADDRKRELAAAFVALPKTYQEYRMERVKRQPRRYDLPARARPAKTKRKR